MKPKDIVQSIRKETDQKLQVKLDTQAKQHFHDMQLFQAEKLKYFQMNNTRSLELQKKILEKMDQILEIKMRVNQLQANKECEEKAIGIIKGKTRYLGNRKEELRRSNQDEDLLDRFQVDKRGAFKKFADLFKSGSPITQFDKNYGQRKIFKISLNNMYITNGGEGHSFVSLKVDFRLGQQRGNFDEMNNQRREHGQMHGNHYNQGHQHRNRNQRRRDNKDKAIAIIYGKRCEAEYLKNQFREIEIKVRNCHDEIRNLERSLAKIQADFGKETRNLVEMENLASIYKSEYEEVKKSRDKGIFAGNGQQKN